MIIFSGCGDSGQEKVSHEVNIVLDYDEVFLASNTPMNVYVDDIKLGKQEAGTERIYTVTLEEGKHKVYLKNDGPYSTDKIEINVAADKTNFKFAAQTRLTFGVAFELVSY